MYAHPAQQKPDVRAASISNGEPQWRQAGIRWGRAPLAAGSGGEAVAAPVSAIPLILARIFPSLSRCIDHPLAATAVATRIAGYAG
jgi:hypothetical protein